MGRGRMVTRGGEELVEDELIFFPQRSPKRCPISFFLGDQLRHCLGRATHHHHLLGVINPICGTHVHDPADGFEQVICTAVSCCRT